MPSPKRGLRMLNRLIVRLLSIAPDYTLSRKKLLAKVWDKGGGLTHFEIDPVLNYLVRERVIEETSNGYRLRVRSNDEANSR